MRHIAAAVLTVTGILTLLAFFRAGSPLLGALNDLNRIAAALVPELGADLLALQLEEDDLARKGHPRI